MKRRTAIALPNLPGNRCLNCGHSHRTERAVMECEYRLGGERRLRSLLTRHRVPEPEIEKYLTELKREKYLTEIEKYLTEPTRERQREVTE